MTDQSPDGSFAGEMEAMEAIEKGLAFLKINQRREERKSDVHSERHRRQKIQGDEYPNSNGKGLAVILVNRFDHEDFKNFARTEAAKVDVGCMRDLWQNVLKGDFHVYEDKSAIEMKQILEEVTVNRNETYDYVVVIISTHGGMYAESVVKQLEEDIDPTATPKDNHTSVQQSQKKAEESGETSSVEVFFGNDCLPVRERDIKKMFYNNRSTSVWHQKPKFFILDYCRGSEMDFGYSTKPQAFMQGSTQVDVTSLIPSVSDVVVAYATHPNFTAVEHAAGGSWLISTIAEIFGKNYLDTEVIIMLTMVNRKIKEKIAKIYNKEEGQHNSLKAMSVFQSSLDKSFFLSAQPEH